MNSSLPTLDELVMITCGVSETLFGIELHQDYANTESPSTEVSRARGIILQGEKPLQVVVAASPAALRQLARGVLSDCAPSEAEALLDDVLGEMVNLVSGQIRALLEGNYALGLPHPVEPTKTPGPLAAWVTSPDATIKIWAAVYPQ